MALASHLKWEWNDCEAGGPTVDTKRPYGNGDAIRDVAKITGALDEKCSHCHQTIPYSDEKMLALHREMATAVAVILSARTFEPGPYRKLPNGKWARIDR